MFPFYFYLCVYLCKELATRHKRADKSNKLHQPAIGISIHGWFRYIRYDILWRRAEPLVWHHRPLPDKRDKREHM